MNAVDEQALIRRAADDPDAFQELYHRYFRRIYGYVASRISHQQDTEDVISEIFLRVIKNLEQLRNQHPDSFAAWLFVIARNTIADHYRRNGYSETLVPIDVAESLTAAGPEPERVVRENEDAAGLRRLVLSLPERQREIITLRYYGGLHNHEIAVVLGIGEKTVSAYLSRALNNLQEKHIASQSLEAQGSANDE